MEWGRYSHEAVRVPRLTSIVDDGPGPVQAQFTLLTDQAGQAIQSVPGRGGGLGGRTPDLLQGPHVPVPPPRAAVDVAVLALSAVAKDQS